MVKDSIQTFFIPETAKGKRIDIVIADLTGLSRNQIRKLIAERKVAIDGIVLKKPGSTISSIQKEVQIDTLPEERKRIIPENIPLTILFEDEHIIAINKKPGMVVHPGVGHKEGTLVNALEAYRTQHQLPELRLLHRLDKDTSGVLLVSKNEKSFAQFSQLFEKRALEKVYLSLNLGTPKELKGYIDAPIDRALHDRQKFAISASSQSRRALTAYQVIDFFGDISLWALSIHTGRTHQIRVHVSSIGHPILGDETYATDESLRKQNELAIKRQLLHAYRITFVHPITKKEIVIQAPMPYDFKQILGSLSNSKYKVPSFSFDQYAYHHQW
ncbi:MAG: RluA family pseudouridine synthase [Candidatus Abawacabacteria bacterium]|nr:RluA family pseudouridine synthase [Candidatus Abawacabacteria bacterium]